MLAYVCNKGQGIDNVEDNADESLFTFTFPFFRSHSIHSKATDIDTRVKLNDYMFDWILWIRYNKKPCFSTHCTEHSVLG